ncbi:MAG TPA: FtsX-like permease family protein [Bryobacteraceae bacterium]|nr:FtsX-like permease family protein [Bryobacteraceae bacterium]
MRFAQFRHAVRLAWKNLRTRPARSALVVVALALSISGVSGVRGAVRVALDALHQGSRTPLAGDLSIDTGDAVSAKQYAALDALRQEGIEWTLVTLALTMAASSESPDAVFVAVKAVDPAVYPFYGGEKLTGKLRGDGVVVSENTLRRLHVRVGDPIRIAGREFHISATGKAEPEQLLGILDRGMRCTLSRENFRKTGIARAGNASKNRILLRVPAGVDLGDIKRRLRPLLQDGVVLDYQDVNQNIGLRIDGLAVYVGETALLALALGSMGVAIAVRQHLEERVEIFATMKMVGARNSQLVAMFFAETALLIAAALPLGVALGWLLKMTLLSIAAKFFPLPPVSGGNGVLFLEAAGAAILAMIPAVVEPIWMLCRLRPAVFLRKEARIDYPGRVVAWTSAALLYAALVAIAERVLGGWKEALLFSGGLFVGAALCFLLAKLFLRAIAAVRGLPAAVRLGVANLTRPGNRATLMIAAIASGAMMMVATVESGLVTMRAVDAKLPYDLTDSLLIAGFQAYHREEILSFARSVPGVLNAEMKTQAGIRLIAVNGLPLHTTGSWYAAGCSDRGLTIDRSVERRTGATVGSQVDFIIGNRKVSTKVASVIEEELSYPIQVDCENFDGARLFHQAVVRASPGQLMAVDAAIRDRFPSLAVVTAPEIEEVILDISRDAKRLARVVAAVWIAAGLLILMTLVAASRSQRLVETGTLSALGATPRVLAGMYTVEFACIGAIAGIIGSALACALSGLLLGLIFQRWEIAFEWPVAAGAVLSSALLTTAAAWIPTYPLLRQKPMNVLRGI